MAVPCVTANNWDSYRVVHGRLLVPLEAGKQIIRVNITGSSCNIDKFVFKHVEVDNNMSVSVVADPSPATVGENTTITVNASSATSTIDNVKIYLEGVLLKTLTSEPFETTYKPTAKGTVNFFVIATDAEGKQSPIVRKTITVNNKRSAFRTVVNLPGVIQAENFDKGGEGLTFHDSDSNDEGGTSYRTDNEGVDIVSGGSGYVIGYTAADEWLEYTVNFTQPGKYSYEATVSSGATGSGFTIGLVENGKVTNLAKVNVPQTASNSWDTYKVVSGNLNKEFETGQQILRITINGAYCNIDKIELKSTNGIDDATAVQQVNGPSYNLMGMKVGADYKGIVIKNGKKYLKK